MPIARRGGARCALGDVARRRLRAAAAHRRRRRQRRPGPAARRREAPGREHARGDPRGRATPSTTCVPGCRASRSTRRSSGPRASSRSRSTTSSSRCCSGCALVVLVLIAFLYEWRAAFISLVAIPLSLVAAGVVLDAAGRVGEHDGPGRPGGGGRGWWSTTPSSTWRTSSGACGRTRRAGSTESLPRSSCTPRWRCAARSSTRRSSTSRPCCRSSSCGSLTGAFFRPLALSYALAVLVSMVVALTVTPALSLILLPRGTLKRRESPLVRGAQARLRSGPGARDPPSARGLRRRRRRRCCSACVVVPAARPGALPELQGARLPHALDHDAGHVDAGGAADRRRGPATRCGPSTACGTSGRTSARPSSARRSPGANFGENWVSVDPKADYDKTLAAIHEVVDGHPGLYRNVQTYMRERIDEVLAGTSEPIVVRIYGDDLGVLRRAADRVRAAIADVPGLVDLHTSLQDDVPQIDVARSGSGSRAATASSPATCAAPRRRSWPARRWATSSRAAGPTTSTSGARRARARPHRHPAAADRHAAPRPGPARDAWPTCASARRRTSSSASGRRGASTSRADLPTGRDLGSVTRRRRGAPAGRRPAAGLPRRAARRGRRAQGRPGAPAALRAGAPRS